MIAKTSIALLFATLIATNTRATDLPLKNRSIFSANNGQHNPFWPIGWTKTSNGASADVLLSAANFIVSSILLNNPPLAVINGKEMAEGEVIAVKFDNQQLIVQLAAVQDGRVVLRYRDQQLVVPLRRRGEESPMGPKTAQR